MESTTTMLQAPISRVYQDGEEIPQLWSPIFILFAFLVSFTASFSAVRLLDHTTWRSEKEREHAHSVIIRFPKVLAATLLGFGTVWSMHFVGMAAVTLEHTAMCYNWAVTLASLVSAVFFMWVGVSIAEWDTFAQSDRIEVLKEIIVQHHVVTAKGKHNEANRVIHMVAFFYKPQFIVAGGFTAATGALLMHYSGMSALDGPFTKRWNPVFVALSALLGIVVCSVGFWILFRLLRWKVEQYWLRPVSAVVLAVAVCTLHFFAMIGVEYRYDGSRMDVCGGVSHTHDPDRWTQHQILALAVSLCIPMLALIVESLISRELFQAYTNLKNPSLEAKDLLRQQTSFGDQLTKEFETKDVESGTFTKLQRSRSMGHIVTRNSEYERTEASANTFDLGELLHRSNELAADLSEELRRDALDQPTSSLTSATK